MNKTETWRDLGRKDLHCALPESSPLMEPILCLGFIPGSIRNKRHRAEIATAPGSLSRNLVMSPPILCLNPSDSLSKGSIFQSRGHAGSGAPAGRSSYVESDQQPAVPPMIFLPRPILYGLLAHSHLSSLLSCERIIFHRRTGPLERERLSQGHMPDL